MNRLTEYSRTNSLSYRVVTHDRKGREGKGIGNGLRSIHSGTTGTTSGAPADALPPLAGAGMDGGVQR